MNVKTLDFARCRDVWVPDDSEAGGFWSPPPPHVRYGVEQIIAHPFFLLADDMGAMKTAQACIAAQFLHDTDVIDRVIVIAPAALRSAVWFDEALGQLREQVFEDKRNHVTEYHARIRSWAHGPQDAKELRWIISNYESPTISQTVFLRTHKSDVGQRKNFTDDTLDVPPPLLLIKPDKIRVLGYPASINYKF